MGVGYHSVTFAFARFKGLELPADFSRTHANGKRAFFRAGGADLPFLNTLVLVLVRLLERLFGGLGLVQARALAEATVQLAASTGSEAIA